MRKTSLNLIYQYALNDDRIIFVGSDLGAGTLDNFKKDIPNQFFMEGVSEAHVIGMAAGMAMDDKIVYVNTIATFLTRRCYEQLVNDVCLHNLKVRLVGNGGGLVYAPLGPTHLATDDIAILRAIPNMTIIAPCDSNEMSRLIPQSIDWPGPLYIRLAKGGDEIVSRDDLIFKIGDAIEIACGNDILLVTTGITLRLAIAAADKLGRDGLSVGILHMHTIKPLDKESLISRAGDVSVLVSIEEHSMVGGLGSAVIDVLAETKLFLDLKIRRIAIPDSFPKHYGTQDSLMSLYGITSENIARVAKAAFSEK